MWRRWTGAWLGGAVLFSVNGATWLGLTMLFELGLGHCVRGLSWPELAEDYDVAAGRVWIVVPLWTAIGPSVIRRWDGADGIRRG
ncbi:hypothetical protein BH20ACT9_BH20ACT9_07180 [soil metagenome]